MTTMYELHQVANWVGLSTNETVKVKHGGDRSSSEARMNQGFKISGNFPSHQIDRLGEMSGFSSSQKSG